MKRFLPICLVLAPVLAGCAVKPKPPVFNLYPRKALAILPVINDTKDAALGAAVRDRLVAALRALGPVPLADPDRVLEAAAGPAPAATPWTDPALRRRVSAATGSDLIVAVTVPVYKEELESETPKRIRSDFSYATFRWGWADTATARVDAVARIADATTGKVLYTRKSSAEISRSRWTDLAWPGDNPDAPKTGWDSLKHNARPATDPGDPGLRYPVEPLVADARAEAIAEAVHGLLVDFRGRDGWVPPAAPSATAP